ncbi:MAG: hypothetical protein AYK23_05480 [Candidatus Proteinoplasmatales archaeon SG8-5]|nr:MAG: hypothetical protein AYK23_05480 [Candidatus Proteinoplasmatales archaeon SG8-5]
MNENGGGNQDSEDEYCIIMTSCPNNESAEEIIEALLERNQAACIQITNIDSYYRWQGRINLEQERLLLIKTRSILYQKVERTIKDNHPYRVPEIIMVPITAGSEDYFKWMDEVTEGP